MRSRLVMLMALAIAAAAVTFAVSRIAFSSSSPRPPATHATTLAASPASYLGVYAAGSPSAYQPVADFAKAAGRQPNLIGYFSGWTEPFAIPFAQQIRHHGAVTIVQIDPTLASVPGIAAGRYDSYLRTYADSVRDFGHPVVIGFGHEMNAPWYPWGYHRLPPQTFVAAWRHIVTLFRRQGADNVTWLWTINADRSDTGPIRSWWPGARYVTWVGIDGYYYRPSDTFATVFGTTIHQVRAFAHKPVLLSETAVGRRADQYAQITNLFTGMKQYNALGLVWFDKAQHDGVYHQDWRIDGDLPAEIALQLGLSQLTLAPH
jgi:mannan endo-1,4-beta-mannosidase